MVKEKRQIVVIRTKNNGTFVEDWEYVEGLGNLEKCNDTKINGSYAYMITDQYPYISRFLNGEFEEKCPSGPPSGRRK